jgi:malate permease and related proteins
MWQALYGIVGPVLAVAALGYLIERRMGLDLRTLAKLNLYVLVPSFILVHVASAPVGGALGLGLALVTVAIILGMGLVAHLLAGLLGLARGERISVQLASMFYNCGNFGLPLMALAFGAEGAARQVFVLMTMNVSAFTLGLWLSGRSGLGEGRAGQGWVAGLAVVARQPAVYAISLGLLLRAAGNPLERVTLIWAPLEMLSAALVGMALLTLGVQMAQVRPARLGRGLWLALALRLVGGPALALGLGLLLRLDGMSLGVVVLGASAPTAVNIALLAHEHGGDEAFAATAVFYGTVASLVSTSVVLVLLRGIGVV